MKKSICVILLLIAAIILSGCIEQKFVGGKAADVKSYEECKRTCEETAKETCYDLFEICQQSGQLSGEGGLLIECNEYLQQNPKALDKYRCTFAIGQTMVGAESLPCSFSCK